MQEVLPQFPRSTYYILDKPVYPTSMRLISLTDICIHYLINHSEIPITLLPLELKEHIENRKNDECYRVLPAYSEEKWNRFGNIMREHLDRFYIEEEKANRINIMLKMFQSVDEDIESLRYTLSLSLTIKQKLIDLPKQGFPIETSRYYLLKWFSHKLDSPSPLLSVQN